MKKIFVVAGFIGCMLLELSTVKAKNGIISFSGLLRGAHFRVQYIIPMRGNFSNYDKVEIAKLESALGDQVPQEKKDKFIANLKSTFEKMRLFSSVEIIDSFDARSKREQEPNTNAAAKDIGKAAPMKRTLVITGNVVDYAKGNRLIRELGVGLAPSVFTVRFSIFDKETRQELARGNLSGVVQATWMSVPGISSNDVGFQQVGIGITDQVERRTAAALE